MKTDPYTKAGLISSWYASLSISQLILRPFCDAQSKACLQKYVFSTSANHPIVRCYVLLHYSKAAGYLSARSFLHVYVLHCRDLQPFNAVVGTEISSS